MRLATLTGEHNFFTRYEDAAVIARGIEARLNRLNQANPPQDEPADSNS
jgi:hypothetical protein